MSQNEDIELLGEMSVKCWHSIGIYGDQSCKQLKKSAHCVHCPAYTSYARRFLDHEAPDEYYDQWTRMLDIEPSAKSDDLSPFLVFSIKSQWIAVNVHCVKEVIKMRDMQPIPHRVDPDLLGIVRVQGSFFVVVALDRILRLRDRSKKSHINPTLYYSRILILEEGEFAFAAPVEGIEGIYYFKDERIQGDDERFIQGLAYHRDERVKILSPELLFKGLREKL